MINPILLLETAEFIKKGHKAQQCYQRLELTGRYYNNVEIKEFRCDCLEYVFRLEKEYMKFFKEEEKLIIANMKINQNDALEQKLIAERALAQDIVRQLEQECDTLRQQVAERQQEIDRLTNFCNNLIEFMKCAPLEKSPAGERWAESVATEIIGG